MHLVGGKIILSPSSAHSGICLCIIFSGHLIVVSLLSHPGATVFFFFPFFVAARRPFLPVPRNDFPVLNLKYIAHIPDEMLSILMAAHLLALVAMLLATTASAQSHSSTTGISTTSTTRATSTTTTAVATHTVQVGSKEDPHQYSPHNVSAAVGDIIVFEFYPRNHSVVKADYLAPCVPASGEIFYSGIFNSFNEEDGQLVGPVCLLPYSSHQPPPHTNTNPIT